MAKEVLRKQKTRMVAFDRSSNVLDVNFADDTRWHHENAKRHGYAVLRNFPR